MRNATPMRNPTANAAFSGAARGTGATMRDLLRGLRCLRLLDPLGATLNLSYRLRPTSIQIMKATSNVELSRAWSARERCRCPLSPDEKTVRLARVPG
jgi:hypothetical protein